ncbi:MAG: hypothetical protein FJ029_06505 [Actinobacteria bacterium]|nr:hypothetical protein [Actinomycetota bacterium]
MGFRTISERSDALPPPAMRVRGGSGTLSDSTPSHPAPSTLAPDAALARRLLADDPHALAQLYDLLGGSVLAMARRALAPAVAEEVVHDVFLHVWTRRHQYLAERGALTAWVLRIAPNRARPQTEPMADDPDRHPYPDGGLPPDHQVWLGEQRRMLRAAMEELSSDETDALKLA